MIIGIRVLPERFTRAAPAGTRTSPAAPACAIFAPSTTSVAFSITRPSPTMRRAPSYAVTWANAGLDEEEGRVALAGLASTAVDAVGRFPFEEAMTGPVARRDVATVRLHENALAPRPDLAALYALLARETLARTLGRGGEAEIGAFVGHPPRS